MSNKQITPSLTLSQVKKKFKVLERLYKNLGLRYKNLTEKVRDGNRLKKSKTQELAALYEQITGHSVTHNHSLYDYALNIYDYLDNIIALAPGNIFWVDKNNVYLGCNEEHARTAGCSSREEIIGKTNADLPWKAQAKILDATNKKIMKTGKPLALEEVGESAYGKKVYWSKKAPLRDKKGNIIGLLGTTIDITELKETQEALLEAKEKAEEANIAKDMFMENISHDFKTYLNAIWGIAQILTEKKNEIPANIYELIELQQKSIIKLKRKIEIILDFHKLYAGKLIIDHEEINLLDIIEGAVDSVSFKIKNKDLNIMIDYPADVPKRLLSDLYCMDSIILNLMSNALKFTEKGYITISVKKLTQKDNHVQLQISVADTGPGIPKDKFNVIFERFHRLELSNTGEKEGHGIGLAAVKELVSKLNGTLQLESELGKGSIFTVTLPFELVDMSFWVSKWEKNHPNVHILVIVDKKTATNILFSYGGRIDRGESSTAQSLLIDAKKNNNPYQILIVDDEINTDPFTLIESIKKMKDIPPLMVMLSAKPNKDNEWYNKARKAGCFNFFTKPLLPSEAGEKIAEAWHKWQKTLG